MKDIYGRKINYMRISITDRCNLRCRYCMPDGIATVPMREVLSYEEILQVCRQAVRIGITRFKVTGGEPLVRIGCPELVGKMKRIPGVEQVTLTTNGILLKENLPVLLENGLDGVNISLDTMDAEQYKEITGWDGLSQTLAGIDEAVSSGVRTKVNCVMQRDVTVSQSGPQWKKLVQLAKDRPIDVRFIEMMPIGYGKDFPCLSTPELLELFQEAYPGLAPDHRVHGNGPAVYYQIPGFQGSVGFISAIHGKFCSSCNRIRMTAQGEVKPCLCYGESIPLKPILRGTASPQDKDEQVCQALIEAVRRKPGEHCFEAQQMVTENHQMVQIGG